MKRYLNRDEKHTVLLLASLVAYMQDYCAMLDKLKKPALLRKWSKMTLSFATKTLDEIMLPLDVRERIKMVEESKKMQVVAVYNDQARRLHREAERMESNTTLPNEHFYVLARRNLILCQVCQMRGDKVTECAIRKMLMDADIEALNYEAPDGVCQYQEREESHV